jgi:DNA cross-link repair 1B protein
LTRVRAVPRYSFTIENLEALNTVCLTIGIMPSSIPLLWKSCEDRGESKGPIRFKGQNGSTVGMDYDPLSPPKLFEKYAYTLPYSEHACFSELKDFMQAVQPSTVKGIVRSSFCYVNPHHYFRHLCGDNDVHAERSPAKNKGGYTSDLTPKRRPDNLMLKRRPNGSTTPKERKFRISSSSLSKVAMKRKECCGAKIDDTEEVICVV